MKQLTMREPIFLTADQLETAVRKLFAGNSYTVLSQVRNGTGFSKQPRTADMLAISTWPSRGLYVAGIEIKVNKYDLQRELANAKKADEIARYCRLWYVAIPEGLDDNLIIPDAWGVITVNAKLKARIVRSFTLKPVPMDDLLVCSILRNFAESHVNKSEVDDRVKIGIEERVKHLDSVRTHRLKNLEDGIQKFKEHSGIDLMNYGSFSYDTENIGAAIKLLTAMRNNPAMELEKAKSSLERGLRAIDEALAVINHAAAQPVNVARSTPNAETD